VVLKRRQQCLLIALAKSPKEQRKEGVGTPFPRKAVEQYRAPSWPWAAVERPNSFPPPKTGFTTDTVFPKPPICEILEASTELATAAKFGQVKGGFRILAPFQRCDDPGMWTKHPKESDILGWYCHFGAKCIYDVYKPDSASIVFAIQILIDRGLLVVATAGEDEYKRVGAFVFDDDPEYPLPNLFQGCRKKQIVIV